MGGKLPGSGGCMQQSGAKILPLNAAVTNLRNETARLRLSENSQGPKKETIVHANKRIVGIRRHTRDTLLKMDQLMSQKRQILVP